MIELHTIGRYYVYCTHVHVVLYACVHHARRWNIGLHYLIYVTQPSPYFIISSLIEKGISACIGCLKCFFNNLHVKVKIHLLDTLKSGGHIPMFSLLQPCLRAITKAKNQLVIEIGSSKICFYSTIGSTMREKNG